MLQSSQKAIDLIVSEEVLTRAYYDKTEARPDWPGGFSGVTVGIGYDCGYATAGEIRGDWSPFLPSGMVDQLCGVAGIHAPPAQSEAHRLHGSVIVPWDAAMAVFM